MFFLEPYVQFIYNLESSKVEVSKKGSRTATTRKTSRSEKAVSIYKYLKTNNNAYFSDEIKQKLVCGPKYRCNAACYTLSGSQSHAKSLDQDGKDFVSYKNSVKATVLLAWEK